MKIHCPVCEKVYNIPSEKFSKPAIKAVCKQCHTQMLIDRETGTATAISETPSQATEQHKTQGSSSEIPGDIPSGSQTSVEDIPEPRPTESKASVASMSPEYPRYRDAVIIVVAALILVMLLAGGYLFVRHSETVLQEFTRNPIKRLSNLINKYETYKTCESFLRHNKGLFRQLGTDLRFSLIKEEIRVSRGKKTARVIIRAQGSAETRNIFFHLSKRKGRWRITSVALELGRGEFKTLYPRGKIPSNDV
jgi:hypothetical protein